MPASAQYDSVDLVHSSLEKGILVSRSVNLPHLDVDSVFHTMESPRTIWSSPQQPLSLSFGAAITLRASGEHRFEQIKKAATLSLSDTDIETASDNIPALKFFGGFSFDAHHKESPLWSGFPSALFVLPRVQLVQSKNGFELTLNEYGTDIDSTQVELNLLSLKSSLESISTPLPHLPSAEILKLTPSVSNKLWASQLTEVLNIIENGPLDKVVLAQSLRATLKQPLIPLNTFYKLRDQNPGCYHFLFEPIDGNTMFGATPELLVSRDGNVIQTEALAGSIARGNSESSDLDLSKELLRSSKNQHEHSIVLETLKSKISSFATDIEITPQKIKKLETVQHIWTTMKATLDANDHILSIASAFHPTPAISGIPSNIAQDIINSTEPFERGWYGGPFGWFDSDGNGEFAVSIRSAIAHKNEVMLYAGAGIVPDSNPQEEWNEIQLKFQPILNSLTQS